MKKIIGLFLSLLCGLAMIFVPQSAFALTDITDSVVVGENELDLTKAPGNNFIIDFDTGKLRVRSTYSSKAISTSRGCYKKGAACWSGGTALGDLQFDGTGTTTGNWPYRNKFESGNKNAQVKFDIGGALVTATLRPYESISREVYGSNSAVTGKYVRRF